MNETELFKRLYQDRLQESVGLRERITLLEMRVEELEAKVPDENHEENLDE